ncbi:MAG: HD domain-containing protein [Clostridiales bacterium]|nr:HD domain-containing protein [Clostridiales bacterium]
MHLFTDEEIRAFSDCISTLAADSRVCRLRTISHHHWTNRYEHALLVSYLSFVLARRWHWDCRAAARAGLLHDLFFQESDNSLSLCLHHPEMAAENAAEVTHLTDQERNIILSHMWPAGRYLPRSREAWLVNVVDDLVAVLDLTALSRRWSRRLRTAPVG